MLLCEGFIDFIVEPSFQVMSDIIDKILEPMQSERQKPVLASNDSRQCFDALATQQSIAIFTSLCAIYIYRVAQKNVPNIRKCYTAVLLTDF